MELTEQEKLIKKLNKSKTYCIEGLKLQMGEFIVQFMLEKGLIKEGFISTSEYDKQWKEAKKKTAKKLKCSKKFLNKMLKGKDSITLEDMVKLSIAMGKRMTISLEKV